MAAAGESSEHASDPGPLREVRFRHSPELVPILERLNVSLLVSAPGAGKLIAVGHAREKLVLALHNFDRAMGIAPGTGRIAIGTRQQVWTLHAAPQIAHNLRRDHPYDACYLARSSLYTGDIHGREMAWLGEELWIVNSLFSCLASLHEGYSFVPRWRPRFISQLAAEDRCHLNGLAVDGGQPKYVTARAATDSAGGWRAARINGGCVIDVPSGEVVAGGLTMPASPRIHQGRLFALESGAGRLVVVDPSTGQSDAVCQLPGYTRGLAFCGQLAFVGLSKLRQAPALGEVPIARQRDQLKCGMGVVDLKSGSCIASLEFDSGLDEVFDVQVLPGVRLPALFGPAADLDGGGTIWLVPDAAQTREIAGRSSKQSATDWGPAVAHYNHANALMNQDQWEAAAAAYTEALRLRPDMALAHSNLGVALENQLQFDEAARAFRRALDYDARLPEAHFNLALLQLLRGRFAEGWAEYEWRWECKSFDNRPSLPDQLAPRWDGSALHDQSLLVYGEQGVGDEVMFASCYAEIARQAKHCTLACDPRLVPLFARSFPTATVCSLQWLHEAGHEAKLPTFDVQIAAGSVPRYLRPREASFGREPSYLAADPARTEHWKSALKSRPGQLAIGVSWRGGKARAEARRRSLSLDEWLPILTVPDVEFVNLQYGDCRDELRSLHERHGVKIVDFAEIDPLRDLDEYAALMTALDLVISIDNSTVHLAGSLGVPTWALVAYPSQSFWRWLWDRDDTQWYSSVRLLRKIGAQPWHQIVGEVAKQLREEIA